MSDAIVRKKRNTHERSRKRIMLGITADPEITVKEVSACLQADSDISVVRVLRTTLKGKSLKSAVRSYMRDNGISKKNGDKVFFLDESKKGGGVVDCNQSE